MSKHSVLILGLGAMLLGGCVPIGGGGDDESDCEPACRAGYVCREGECVEESACRPTCRSGFTCRNGTCVRASDAGTTGTDAGPSGTGGSDAGGASPSEDSTEGSDAGGGVPSGGDAGSSTEDARDDDNRSFRERAVSNWDTVTTCLRQKCQWPSDQFDACCAERKCRSELRACNTTYASQCPSTNPGNSSSNQVESACREIWTCSNDECNFDDSCTRQTCYSKANRSSQCKREFVEGAWRLRTLVDFDDDGSEDEMFEVYLDLREDGTYWLNHRVLNSGQIAGFCREPGTRNGTLRWEMVDCQTIRLQSGCGETETAVRKGQKLEFRSRHGDYDLDHRTDTSSLEEDPSSVANTGGCWSSDWSAEPNCK